MKLGVLGRVVVVVVVLVVVVVTVSFTVVNRNQEYVMCTPSSSSFASSSSGVWAWLVCLIFQVSIMVPLDAVVNSSLKIVVVFPLD